MTTHKPFILGLSLALDRLIVALERPAPSPAQRNALRREKARLEQQVQTRRAPRCP